MKILLILFIIFSLVFFVTNQQNTFSKDILIPETQRPSYLENTPSGSPFRGAYQITAYFHDKGYFQTFHHDHTGIDLIPLTSPHEPTTNPVLLHATISGIATWYHEACSGSAVIITNDTYTVYMGHIASYLVQNNTAVKKDQNVAIMGKSGQPACITGPHVHYQLYNRIKGRMILIDPLPYLQHK